jgi:hypothetical protein
MKPLKCRNWSGRNQSLIPPAVTIAIFAILSLIGTAGTCLSQGTVNWATISPFAITAQTNAQQSSPLFGSGGTNVGTIGLTASASSGLVYYYELLYNTNFTGSQLPTPAAAALLGTWLDTGLTATNGNVEGRLFPVNPNSVAVVPWDNGTTNNIMLVGWSANLGASWAVVSITLSNWAYCSSNFAGEAFFGESATGYLTPQVSGASSGATVFATGPTANGLPINSPNMQLYCVTAMLTVTSAPVIVVSPANQRIWPNGSADFSVVAVGVLPMTYQWFFGTNTILPATNSTLHLVDVQPRQMGTYTVVVTNIYGAATSAPAMLELYPTVTVTNCSDASLRAEMAGGGTVTFACDGTIILTNTITISGNTILDGTGHQITISGGNAVRVFYVNSNVNLTISNLTIADGLNADGYGGGIYNAGNLTAMNCVFANNTAIGPAGAYNSGGSGSNSLGGAIYNIGFLNAIRCTFQSNSTVGGDGVTSSGGSGGAGGDGYGGAIENLGASIMTECWLANNRATGGSGGPGADGGTTFGYPANGYPGGMGGKSGGGAIGNFGTLTMSNCLLASNSATGGLGAHGGNGGLTAQGPGGMGGRGGSGGDGNGGALFNSGSAVLLNDTIALNLGAGNQGGSGGNVGIGAPDYPRGSGGWGGSGGSGYGAIYDANGQCYLTNCTVALNRATPGTGGSGGLGGQDGANGVAGGLKTVGASLLNTLLSGNTPTNCIGTAADAGHNLSSDGSCAFTNLGSLNNTDTRLGLLADNGGPTWTMALLPGSPAIDAGSAIGALATDQRGVPRPQGPGVDIGAFEYLYSSVFTGAIIRNATNCQMQLSGMTLSPALTLQVSTNLLNWWDATNFLAGSNGMFQCVDPIPGDTHARFYRLKSGTP